MGRDLKIGREDFKIGRAKIIQIRQKDFLQNQNFQKLQTSFHLLSLSKFLHHTHLVGFISMK